MRKLACQAEAALIGAVAATVLLLALSPFQTPAVEAARRSVDLSDFVILVSLFTVVAVVSLGLNLLLCELFTSRVPSVVTGIYAALLPMSTAFWMSLLDGPTSGGFRSSVTPLLAVLAIASGVAGVLAAEVGRHSS